MTTTFQVADDVATFSTYEPVPGFGVLPINFHLLRGAEPVLIDTGLARDEADVLDILNREVGPAGPRWVFISHADGDHAGNLRRILEIYPNTKVIANFTTRAKLAGEFDFPFDRLFAINPGQSFETADRVLQVFQPPLYDAGGSLGFYDTKSGVLFGADTFGSIIPDPATALSEVPEEPFFLGFSLFNRANTPWVVDVDETKFAASLNQVRNFHPAAIIGGHLPVAYGKTEELLRATAELPSQGPAPLPDQAMIDALLAQMAAGAPA
jgi:glyoxylase-like metal-dependent hydrolase (beta-lactamase superfamily II)